VVSEEAAPKAKQSTSDNEENATVAQPRRATFTVQLPRDARLYVEGVYCPLTSSKRTFRTPALEPGQEYTYTLRAEVVRAGKPVRKTKQVQFTAGQAVRVNFSDLSMVSTPER
jgi:uncharacterized protein (TIGR03000 family)